MESNYIVRKGKPIFGANVYANGTNFGLFSRNARKVYLEVYKEFYDGIPSFKYELNPLDNKTGDVWHVFIEPLTEKAYYGWRIEGPYSLEEGHRFNKNKLLIDPYAKAVSGTYDFDNIANYGYDKSFEEKDDSSFSKIDSANLTCKSIIIDDSKYDWEQDKNPRIPFKDTVIYEMHVRLFTMNSNSKVEQAGTFQGLIEKIDHLKSLGVTAIELLPIFESNFNSITNTNPYNGEYLKDVWGYNPLSYFAISGNYTHGMNLGEQVFEFKDFIKQMHKNGIEVILDVVYNHTGEGNEHGPTISFKGIDNSVYYILEENKRYYSNYSGTGNTLNCSHAVVKQMILDSLRYWVTEMHVDGFRFDLAAILGRDSNGNWIGDLSLLKDIADDPILSGSKLIAEGWDAAGGYFVGEFPVGWAEWNGKFRDTVRTFVRGDEGAVADLATRIVGSPDLFGKYGRKPYHSINFITAHDGFTMWDLVSYNEKHNMANGENNRDGMNDNISYNHGFEGETCDPNINKLRKQQIKNFMLILMISQGVPMIIMGDEFARTQQGNNNAYCQDNELNWLDWNRKKEFKDINIFVEKMIEFRNVHHSLKRKHFFTSSDISGNGFADITWHGVELNNPDWSYNSHCLAFMISGQDFSEPNTPEDNDIYVALNSHYEDLDFELPNLEGKKWYRIVDTVLENGEDFDEIGIEVNEKYTVQKKSSIILISKNI